MSTSVGLEMGKRLAVCFSAVGLAMGPLVFSPAEILAEEGKENDSVKEAPSDIEKFLSDGRVSLSGRYRFEYVDQQGITRSAKASTLRTRLGFTSGTLHGLSFKLEVEDVSVIGEDTYNSTVNGNEDRPVVADPDGTEVNEAYVSVTTIPDTVVRAGREALKFDNLRFIGDVGWRQNNQTFDGVNVANTSLEGLRLIYGYVGNVNRIFGEDSSVGDFKSNLQLFNISSTGLEDFTITSYIYLLDVKDSPGVSTANYGIRGYGERPLNESLKLLYDAEYAFQQDYENNPVDYSVHYWRASSGLKFSDFKLSGGFESLGSDDGKAAFSTPFATLHKWNGWADKFLVTPETGLDDAYAGVEYARSDLCECLEKASVAVVYHYFSAEEGSLKYGEEWDADLSVHFSRYFQFGLKYANFQSANFGTDTEKLIFTLQAELSQT